MNVDDYRKEYAARIAKQATASRESPWSAELEPVGGDSSISARIEQLRDAQLDAGQRTRALRQLQAATFTGPKFSPFQASFVQALRSIATSKDDPLRQNALEQLASESDPVARQVLTEGLSDPAKAAVSDAKAIQLLAQDDHAAAASLAKELFAKTSDPRAKEEAVRAMSADPTAVGLLTNIVKDRTLTDQLRSLGASSLRTLDPTAFHAEALRVIADDEESDTLKTRYVVILGRLNGAGALEQTLSDTLSKLSKSTQDGPLQDVLTKVLERR